jgi:PAS domain S-box-containing protein
MAKPLRVLLVEDSEDDAEMIGLELRRSGYDVTWQRVESEREYRACLSSQFDVILCDFNLPGFDALRALSIVQEQNLDVPFIIVSGAIGEDLAVQAMSEGADDYLLKDRLARMGQAVANALEQKVLRDEKRHADQRLRESERRFRALIEHSADVVVLLDPAGTILYHGPSLTTVLGYQPDECLGRSLLDFVHPDSVSRFQHHLNSLRRYLGSSLAVEHRLRHKAGRWYWMEGVATNLLAEPGVEALVVNYRDITERKEAQQALQQAHDQLEERVAERTAELSRTVSTLEMEIRQRHQAEEALAAEKRRLELLYELSQELSATLDLREVADKALNLVMTALGASYGELFLYDHAAERLWLAAAVDPDQGENEADHRSTQGRPPLAELNRPPERRRAPELSPGRNLPGYVAESRVAVALPDVNCEQHSVPLPGVADEICSLAAVPLLAGDELVGVLLLYSEQAGYFGTAHLPLLQAVATPLALSLQNARLYDQVHAGREQLRRLAQRVVWAQEEERQRLSYQLHDEAGQSLSALQINLSLVRNEMAREAQSLRQQVDNAVVLTTQTMDQVRTWAQNLRPPALDVVGLNPTLERLCREVAQRSGLLITYLGTDLPALPGALTISFYRFLQEALANVVKHASATEVSVVLAYDGEWLKLTVQDNGRGFDLYAENLAGQPGSVGLLGLQERFSLLDGRLDIASIPGQGTRLVASAPWQEEPVTEAGRSE